MNILTAFLISVAVAMGIAISVVLFLRRPLYALLVELCGNGARARYWSVFTGLFIVLSTLYALLMSLSPADLNRDGNYPAIAVAVSGFRMGIFGLLLALVSTAFVLMHSVRQHEARSVLPPARGASS